MVLFISFFNVCAFWSLISRFIYLVEGYVSYRRSQGMLTRWGSDLLDKLGAGEIPSSVVHPEHPRPMLARENNWKSLNGIWDCQITTTENVQKVKQKIVVPFPPESFLSGFNNHSFGDSTLVTQRDHLIYTRYFSIPRRWQFSWPQHRILLHFGAVDWKSSVSINDQAVKGGIHKGGYTSFSLDITEYLTSKRGASQKVVLEVWDPTDAGPQPRGKQVQRPGKIWYTPVSGIWQSVWLEMIPRDGHVSGVWVVSDVDIMQVTINVDLEISKGRLHTTEMTATPTADVEVEVDIFGSNSELWKRAKIRAQVVDVSDGEFAGLTVSSLVALPEAILWSPETPQLYDMEVRLLMQPANEETANNLKETFFVPVDTVRSYFAIRKISLGRSAGSSSGQKRLMLNNKPYFQIGLLDQGYWPDGLYTAPSDAALRADLVSAKQLGFNTIRKHVKVESQRWYYWADRLGLLVWQDMPNGDAETSSRVKGPDIQRSPFSKKIFYEECEAIMRQLRGHPSIVMWVVFNEGWGQFDTHQVYDFTRTLEFNLSRPAGTGRPSFHSQESSSMRLINAVSGWLDRGVGDILDVHNYPAPKLPSTPDVERATVVGEYGGLGLQVHQHTWLTWNLPPLSLHELKQQQLQQAKVPRSWSYKNIANTTALTTEFVRLVHQLKSLRDAQNGISAAIYTQTTDVEGEVNGLLTYDREIVKVEAQKVAVALRRIAGRY